jgi:N,N'-diacetyllegionaminate synthase
VSGDPDLCKAILGTKKETIVSLGMWSGTELPFGVSEQVRYLYCVSKYPAHWADMSGFPTDFASSGLHGYSDHTLGLDFCLLAIARGASILEKHFSLNKAGGKPTERAHVCSMTEPELALLRDVGGSMYRARQALVRYQTRR